jgi:uncharacterized Zn-finger protein
MGERWCWILLKGDDTLICSYCDKPLHNQKVHIYLDVEDSLDDIMCEACFKKEQRETDK